MKTGASLARWDAPPGRGFTHKQPNLYCVDSAKFCIKKAIEGDVRGATFALQVTDVDNTSGVINVRLSEMVVGNLNLRFVDRKTSEVREEGATRPEVIIRQLATRPGQVRHCTPSCSPAQP